MTVKRIISDNGISTVNVGTCGLGSIYAFSSSGRTYMIVRTETEGTSEQIEAEFRIINLGNPCSTGNPHFTRFVSNGLQNLIRKLIDLEFEVYKFVNMDALRSEFKF